MAWIAASALLHPALLAARILPPCASVPASIASPSCPGIRAVRAVCPWRPSSSEDMIAQVATRARDCKTFVVQQALDGKDRVDIFTAIQPVPLGAFHRLQHGKLRLPIAQHKWLGGSQAADFADPE